MNSPSHKSFVELEAELDEFRSSPRDDGPLLRIVRRPGRDERESITAGELTLEEGLVGDSWKARESARPGGLRIDTQLALMNSRVVQSLARDEERWALAGDQLFVDLDLSESSLPVGSRLKVGAATIEITAQPHTGCAKFAERYGREALKFISTPTGLAMRMRGVYAKVVEPGAIAVGDRVKRVSA